MKTLLLEFAQNLMTVSDIAKDELIKNLDFDGHLDMMLTLSSQMMIDNEEDTPLKYKQLVIDALYEIFHFHAQLAYHFKRLCEKELEKFTHKEVQDLLKLYPVRGVPKFKGLIKDMEGTFDMLPLITDTCTRLQNSVLNLEIKTNEIIGRMCN